MLILIMFMWLVVRIMVFHTIMTSIYDEVILKELFFVVPHTGELRG